MVDYTVFVVDDEETIREGIASAIEDDYQTFSFEDAESGLGKAKELVPDLVLLDIGLPGMNGVEALKHFKELYEETLVIMITAYEDIHSVIECMKTGAYDYIIKPIYMEGLEITIANALETIRLRKEVQILQQRQIGENLPCFIGESDSVHDLMEYIRLVSRSPDTPILIQGDTGTGKELIASTIHFQSPNFRGPFVPVNCAAIPRELFESELFGYEKGAFSGARTGGKKGLIEMAEDGTLFLDEIGELDQDGQAKLLRFLENGEFLKVGGTERQKVKVRLVAATNRNLDKMIYDGDFRKDLYFRIGVIKIAVPSLNDRADDIPLIARFFLHLFNEKFDRHFEGISEEALDLLKAYSWSGNVRELKNLMERAVLTGKGPQLTVHDLGLEKVVPGRVLEDVSTQSFAPIPPAGMDLNNLKESMDRYYFAEAMKMSKGNESRAAKLIGLKQHTFRYQYKKLFPDN